MAALKAGKGGTYYPPFPVLGLAGDGNQIFLTGGGGGSMASKEVPNVVQAHRYIEATGQLSTIASINTSKSVVVYISHAAALGLWLASAQASCKVLQLSEEANTLEQVAEFQTELEGKDPSQNVARCCPRGELLATGGTDGVVRIWRVVKKLREDPTLLHSGAKGKEVLDVDFSADGKLLASCDRSGACRIFDTSSGAETVVIKYDHAGPPKAELAIRGVRFFAAAQPGAPPLLLIAAAAPRGPACLGVFSTDGKRMKQVVVDKKPLTALGMNAKGNLAAVNLVTGGKRIYSLPALRLVRGSENAHELPAPCVAFIGESTAVSGSGDRSINLFNYSRGSICGSTIVYVLMLMLIFAIVAFLVLRIGMKAALLDHMKSQEL